MAIKLDDSAPSSTLDSLMVVVQQKLKDNLGLDHLSALEPWKLKELIGITRSMTSMILRSPHNNDTRAICEAMIIDGIIGTLECRTKEDYQVWKSKQIDKIVDRLLSR